MDACGACDRCLGLDGSPADAKRDGKAAPRSRDRGGRRERGRRSEPEPLAGEAKAVFERLRGLRAKIAREDEVPAFVVFSDRTLREIARARPADAAALLDVPGVGPAKLEKYGDAFLREVQEPG
jgi:ATP-dependent DNA helicase RecQ